MKMFLNVIHRADPGEDQLEGLMFQQEQAHHFGLRTTILLQYPAMLDSRVVEFVKLQHEKFGDEIGIHFHEVMHESLYDIAESREPALYLHTYKSKTAIITHIFDTFERIFGFIPSAIGDYIIDAQALKFIHSQYPQVKAAITNCFEEGVKMYEGNNRNWYLFSDGGPWSAYHPSVSSNLCPAADESDAVGIVGLPHLNRDMILALTSRDDFFSSHPVNVVRAKACEGGSSPYLKRFIDQWIKQAQYNGYSYYSLFVSTPWVLPGCMFVDDFREARALYTESLAYLRQKIDEGSVEAMTISEFGQWFRDHVKTGVPEVNLWNDILCGTKRQMFWYIDPRFRAVIDLNSGGSICDLRPYVSRIETDLGPDTENLWNGNYPFIISTEHRPGSEHSCSITYNGSTAWIGDRRTCCSVEKGSDGRPVVSVNPINLNVGTLKVTIQSIYRFPENGKLEIERRVLDVSDPDADVILTECHRGCWGTTQYPEDMRGMELFAMGQDFKPAGYLRYGYKSRKVKVKSPRYIVSVVPKVMTRVTLAHVDGADEGIISEGHLFSPYYTLELTKNVKKGGSLKSCMILERI